MPQLSMPPPLQPRFEPSRGMTCRHCLTSSPSGKAWGDKGEGSVCRHTDREGEDEYEEAEVAQLRIREGVWDIGNLHVDKLTHHPRQKHSVSPRAVNWCLLQETGILASEGIQRARQLMISIATASRLVYHSSLHEAVVPHRQFMEDARNDGRGNCHLVQVQQEAQASEEAGMMIY